MANPTRPTVQLLSEALERLVAAGMIRLSASAETAATALAAELDLVQLSPPPNLAAAIVALRAAGWPPAQKRDPESMLLVTDAALDVSNMLAKEAPPHVADYLRHAERQRPEDPLRSVDALMPVAERAISTFQKLSSSERRT